MCASEWEGAMWMCVQNTRNYVGVSNASAAKNLPNNWMLFCWRLERNERTYGTVWAITNYDIKKQNKIERHTTRLTIHVDGVPVDTHTHAEHRTGNRIIFFEFYDKKLNANHIYSGCSSSRHHGRRGSLFYQFINEERKNKRIEKKTFLYLKIPEFWWQKETKRQKKMKSVLFFFS